MFVLQLFFLTSSRSYVQFSLLVFLCTQSCTDFGGRNSSPPSSFEEIQLSPTFLDYAALRLSAAAVLNRSSGAAFQVLCVVFYR